jgi:hypothetical protein
MKKRLKCSGIYLVIKMIVLAPVFLTAQPTPGQLADRLSALNSQRISEISTLTITVESEDGGFFPKTTTRYIKTNRDGSDVLITEDTDLDLGVLSGSFDDQFPGLIREAREISETTLNGSDVYKIEVDDADALFGLGTEDTEYAYDDVTVTSAVVWIHKTEMYPLKLEMEQISDEGFYITVTLLMEEYREYSGLPLPHRITMKVDGLDQEIPDSDLEYLRQYLNELEAELQQLPSEQREMAEEQMRPQIEQLERMLESGDMGMTDMVFVVTEVQINQ